MKALTSGKQNARQQQAAVRREQILEAAVRLFARQGVAKTTTRQIAREVGITEGLIFYYFPTRLDLVRAVAVSSHVFLGDLREIMANAATKPLAEVMGQVAVIWLNLLRREADVAAILFGEALINPEMGGVLHEVIGEGSGKVEQFLETRKQANEITPSVDTKTIAHMYMASILVFFLRYRNLADDDWQSEAAVFANNLQISWLRMVTP